MANMYSTQTTMQLVMDKSSVTSAFKNISDGLIKSLGAAREGFEKGKAGLPRGMYGPQGAAASIGNIAGRISGGAKDLEAKGAEITGSKGMEALKTGAVMGTVVGLMKDGNDMLGGLLKMFRIMFNLLILPLIMVLMPIIVPVLKNIAEHTKKFVEAMKTGNVPEMAIEFTTLGLIGILAILAAGVASVTVNLITGAISGAISGLLSGEAIKATVNVISGAIAPIVAWLFTSVGGQLMISAVIAIAGLNIGFEIGQWMKDNLEPEVYTSVRQGILDAILSPLVPITTAVKLIFPDADIELFTATLEETLRHVANEFVRTVSFGTKGISTEESLEVMASRLASIITKNRKLENAGTELAETVANEMVSSSSALSPKILQAWDTNFFEELSSRFGKSQPTRGPLATPTLFERGKSILVLFGQGMESFANPLIGIVTSILESIVSAFNAALKNIVSIVNRMISEANRASSAMSSAKQGSMLNIPRMAEGGIVTSPTLAMIGENGPEAVIPLGKGGGMGENITITNHITVSPGVDKGEMEKMFAKFARDQGKELRRRTSYVGGIYA